MSGKFVIAALCVLASIPVAGLGQATTTTPPVRSRYATPYMQQVQPRTGAAASAQTPAARYSPVESGRLVKMIMDAARERSPMGQGQVRQTTILEKATSKTATGQLIYAPVSTGVPQVLDRGILLLPSGEEMRLRGVFMPSSADTNDTIRLYAKEGVDALSRLTGGSEVYVLWDEPLRDSDGRLLGTVILPDGTELNRRILELGYGSLKKEDFGLGVDFSDLNAAEEAAKAKQLGIWSR